MGGRLAQRDTLLIKSEITLEQMGDGRLPLRFRSPLTFLRRVDGFRESTGFRIGSSKHAENHQIAPGGILGGALREIERFGSITNGGVGRGRQDPRETELGADSIGLQAECLLPLCHGRGAAPVLEQSDREELPPFFY